MKVHKNLVTDKAYIKPLTIQIQVVKLFYKIYLYSIFDLHINSVGNFVYIWSEKKLITYPSFTGKKQY